MWLIPRICQPIWYKGDKMKKYIIVFIVVLIAILVSLNLIKRFSVISKKAPVDAVFLGPKEYKATFNESMGSAREFYDLYGKARDSAKVGDYDTAIKLLNESLPHIGIGLERGMVYKKLAEIYQTQGNLEKELYYVKEFPKYSMNAQLNEEASRRAAEIRQLLAIKNHKPDQSQTL